MAKVTVLLFMSIYITVTVSQNLYPPSWDPYCDVTISTEFVNITCNLKPEDQKLLTLKDLNDYTNNTAANVKYSVLWKCSPNASVTMRLPMQIHKLYSLKVFGCRIFEYYDDWNHQSLGSIKDSLVYEEIADCTLVFHILPLLLSLDNFQNVSNDWMCGPDTTIKQSISRNITSVIIEPNQNDFDNLSNETKLYVQKILFNILIANSSVVPDPFQWWNIKNIVDFDYQPECNYQKLEVLEVVMSETLHTQNLNIIFKSVKRQYPNMRVFNYSYNGYQLFPQEWKENMHKFPKLEYIDYSYNLISDIWNVNRFWDDYPGRHVVLDLRYNNITTLTTETISKWTELQDITLNIRGNPLDCGCFKQDFLNAVQDDTFFDGKMQKYKYIQNMKCASPATARGIKIINLSKAEMGCEIPPDDLTIYLVVLGVLAVVLIVCLILLFKFRKEIKLLLYVKFKVLFPWDVDKSAEMKRFDAFISYSSSESQWVLGHLVQKLESPFESHDALSLCIHERDFICGKSILLNIIDSIENSRHTIVVLSRKFIQSVWSMAEFKEAYEESVTKKRRHLIIIKYESIPEAELDSMLKRCIKSFTYIDVNDPRFIDRLRFSLATKSK
ncbi:hypothetical protein LOTGIDRAFT_159050 [Lottia gigantea]|uniref:TIR domain-containing protein n=1 Tax=Lottia gigantea TaxID=225164 RepID=V4ATL5_LOTGI|nr:hypothetical protein LOTGIDRAFT_159050 [Lottia gigantea]ESO98255.1 hypothetical protein LOTGIDRAFT_159050 [Lottia gigantea]